MSKVRVKMNSKGARALLNSAEVQSDLLRRAGRIQDGANAQLGASDPSEMYQADVQSGRNRARAIVRTSGHGSRRHNAKTNALLKNLDRGA